MPAIITERAKGDLLPRLALLTYGIEYLNKLQADQVNALTEKDLHCWSCGEPWKQGDLIIIKRLYNNKGSLTIKRHAKCAIMKNVITKEDLKRLKSQYRSFGFAAILGFFAFYSYNALTILGALL